MAPGRGISLCGTWEESDGKATQDVFADRRLPSSELPQQFAGRLTQHPIPAGTEGLP
jgi:hypothetical protein